MDSLQGDFIKASAGSLFSCSRSDIPCHHFCLRHSKPLQWEDEEWFMTDEAVEEDEEEEPAEEMEEDGEMMRHGLLDQLLDDAYAQYYDDPEDEWEELATWYSSHMNRGELSDAEHQQPSQPVGAAASSGATQDFHPAWRQDPVGTPRRFARPSENTATSNQGRSTRAASHESSASSSSSHRHQHQHQQQQPTSTGHQQQRRPKERDWGELVDEQEREENGSFVTELELYETFNDLFFPDPESGRL